jgi:hypothetical protein
MAFNVDAIRKKLNDLTGKNNKKNATWRPEEGKSYTVRFIPLPKSSDGSGLRDLSFYYNIGTNPGLLAPYQFGKPDPFQELITKLRSDDSKDSFELAKKLYPKTRAFGAVIVRGEEEKGVRIWSFGKTVQQDLYNVMLDADYGDIMDYKKGYDIKVTCEKLPGKQFADTTIRPRPNPTPLHEDQAKAKEWISSIPNMDEIYVEKSYDELAKLLNDYVNPPESSNASVGTTRDAVTADDVAETPAPKKQASSSSSAKKLDDAFAELDDL